MATIVHANYEDLLNKLIKLHYFEIQEFSIAPNDQEIAIVVGNTDMPYEEYMFDERNRSIWICDIQTGDAKPLTLPEEDTFAPAWSPDGNKIAYFSRASGKKELWLMDQDGSNKKQLTFSEFKGRDPFNGSQCLWSPNGSLIAYTVQPNGSFYGLWQTLEMKHKSPSTIQVETGKNKQGGYYEQARKSYRASLYLLDPETGENKKIIAESTRSLSIIGWWNDCLIVKDGSELFKINPDTHHKELLYKGEAGLIHFMDENLLSARIVENDIEIGHIKEMDFLKIQGVKLIGYDPTLHTWTNDGCKVFFTSRDGLSNILYSVDVHTGEVRALTEKGKTVEDVPISSAQIQCYQQDSVIFPYSGPQEPYELWEATGTGEIRKISHLSRELQPKSLPKVDVLRYESNGWEIESLLVYPKNYDSTKTYPTLIYLHGGPEDYVSANFSELISGRAQSAAHFLAEHGYAVFLPNYRGSMGYGEEFMAELSHYKMTQAPFEDVIAGVDYLINAGIADPEKLGIYGTSYGGILTAWALSQSDRFKGAVAAVGYYDLLSQDRYVNKAFHSIFENRSKGTIPNDLWFQPELYKKLSPMEHFDKIQTPLMFIETSGERDKNGSSARPLFHALTAKEIETYLVYYPEAFHNGAWNDDYKQDYMKRLVAWFDHCIKGIDLPSWFE